MANVTLTKTLGTSNYAIRTINGKTYSFDKNGKSTEDLIFRLDMEFR